MGIRNLKLCFNCGVWKWEGCQDKDEETLFLGG